MTDATQEPGLDAAGLEATDADIAEYERRLKVYTHPSFDRSVVERLIERIRAYEAHRSGAGEAVAWRYRMPNMDGAHWMIVQGAWPEHWGDDWEREPLYASPAKAGEPEAALAERDALVEALTPSGETKAAYIGEFKFPHTVWDPQGEHEITHTVPVPWTTIKEIMKAIRKRAALSDSPASARSSMNGTQGEAEGWRPISEAPKDGTEIIVFGRYWSDAQGQMPKPMLGRWNDRLERWEACAFHQYPFGVRPIVWQPLPAQGESR